MRERITGDQVRGITAALGLAWDEDYRQYVFDTLQKAAGTLDDSAEALRLASGILARWFVALATIAKESEMDGMHQHVIDTLTQTQPDLEALNRLVGIGEFQP